MEWRVIISKVVQLESFAIRNDKEVINLNLPLDAVVWKFDQIKVQHYLLVKYEMTSIIETLSHHERVMIRSESTYSFERFSGMTLELLPSDSRPVDRKTERLLFLE